MIPPDNRRQSWLEARKIVIIVWSSQVHSDNKEFPNKSHQKKAVEVDLNVSSLLIFNWLHSRLASHLVFNCRPLPGPPPVALLCAQSTPLQSLIWTRAPGPAGPMKHRPPIWGSCCTISWTERPSPNLDPALKDWLRILFRHQSSYCTESFSRRSQISLKAQNCFGFVSSFLIIIYTTLATAQ